MKKLVLAAILFANVAMSQETEFKFTQQGFTDFVITNAENKTKSELYNKTLEWISTTYKNPDKVIKSKIENEYIRIEGSSSEIACMNIMGKRCDMATYLIEISFKDGKYKFDVISIKSHSEDLSTHEILHPSFDGYYKKTGEIKGVFKYYPEMIPAYFNSLNNSLKSSLNEVKKEW